MSIQAPIEVYLPAWISSYASRTHIFHLARLCRDGALRLSWIFYSPQKTTAVTVTVQAVAKRAASQPRPELHASPHPGSALGAQGTRGEAGGTGEGAGGADGAKQYPFDLLSYPSPKLNNRSKSDRQFNRHQHRINTNELSRPGWRASPRE